MNLMKLTTEIRNKNTMNIDELSTIDMVRVINEEDKKVAIAVEKELENISTAIDEISEKFINGGRIIYCGAGTSGRLGALDAIELTPTYSVPKERAFGIIAGGKDAMFEAVEGAEDSKELAIKDLEDINLTKEDILIAIAASGRTPYTISAIEYANKINALSISVTCNGDSEMSKIAKISIAPVVGPEVITGSTRMKSGSAQKMVLNMISTGVMVKSGKVFGNLMVNVQPTNLKLVKRAESIICQATDVSIDEAKEVFKEADFNVSTAITMIKAGVNKEKAKECLDLSNGIISKAIKMND